MITKPTPHLLDDYTFKQRMMRFFSGGHSKDMCINPELKMNR